MVPPSKSATGVPWAVQSATVLPVPRVKGDPGAFARVTTTLRWLPGAGSLIAAILMPVPVSGEIIMRKSPTSIRTSGAQLSVSWVVVAAGSLLYGGGIGWTRVLLPTITR